MLYLSSHLFQVRISQGFQVKYLVQRMASLIRHRRASYFHCQGGSRMTWMFKFVSFIWVHTDVPISSFRIPFLPNLCLNFTGETQQGCKVNIAIQPTERCHAWLTTTHCRASWREHSEIRKRPFPLLSLQHPLLMNPNIRPNGKGELFQYCKQDSER